MKKRERWLWLVLVYLLALQLVPGLAFWSLLLVIGILAGYASQKQAKTGKAYPTRKLRKIP